MCSECLLYVFIYPYSDSAFIVLLLIMAANHPSCFVKHKQGKALKSGDKTIVLNVFHKFCEKYPTLTLENIVALTSEFTGVSKASIYNARKEMSNTGKVSTPGKKRKRARNVLDKTCDEFVRSAIRRKVHQFFFENDPPTINKVLSAVNNDADLPNLKRTSLHALLKEIGFEFVSRNRKSVIVERDDIILWRRQYLRNIREYRRQGRPIYYLDETWVNQGHTPSKAWTDSSVKSKKEAFLSGFSTGLKNPLGRGKRLIIVHIGSEFGFVEGGDLVFESKKTSDYHEEMTGEVFKSWFAKVLPKLKPNSVIVMDNAPYHSVKCERIPNKSWRNGDIMTWLQTKNIHFDESVVKAELIELVNACRKQYERFVIDDLAEKAGHTVCRLPPYHCFLNPIEMIWSQVKGYVARNNKTFKLPDVKQLVYSAFLDVTAEKWGACVKHVISEEKKVWELEGMVDVVVDRLVINLGADSDSSSTSDLEGVEPLSSSD